MKNSFLTLQQKRIRSRSDSRRFSIFSTSPNCTSDSRRVREEGKGGTWGGWGGRESERQRERVRRRDRVGIDGRDGERGREGGREREGGMKGGKEEGQER